MMAEDCNTFVSDCIVVSCCCQCLILQLVVFVFTQLPRKLARKTKEYTKKNRRRRKTKDRSRGDGIGFDDGRTVSMQMLELEWIAMNKLHRWGSCLDEVEKVLEGLSMKGEFAFGSFWGGNHHRENGGFLECGDHVVHYHLIEVVGSAFVPS